LASNPEKKRELEEYREKKNGERNVWNARDILVLYLNRAELKRNTNATRGVANIFF